MTPITIKVLVENSSQAALGLFERKLLDPPHEDEDKISWMRGDVLTHRNSVPLLESCERLIKGQLSDRLKSELVDVLFDYRPAEWFFSRVDLLATAELLARGAEGAWTHRAVCARCSQADIAAARDSAGSTQMTAGRDSIVGAYASLVF